MRRLRDHFQPCESCVQPQPTEEAGQPPHRKASPASYLQPSCLRSGPKVAAAPLVIPHQPSNSTGQQSPRPAPTGEGLRHSAPQRTKNYSAVPLQPGCPRSGPKVAAAPLVIPRRPSNSTGQRSPHAAPTGEGRRHWAPQPTMNSTAPVLPGCLRSEPMEAAAPRARHPYWALSKPVLRKALQDRAREQPQKSGAAPAGALQPGRPGAAGPRPQLVPSTRSAASPRWLRTAP